jgi:hypothetical protein
MIIPKIKSVSYGKIMFTICSTSTFRNEGT